MNSPKITVPGIRSGVYYIRRAGQVIYIGSSVNVWYRIAGYDFVKTGDEIDVEFVPVTELAEREKAAIELHRPRLNVQGVTRPYIAPKHRAKAFEDRRAPAAIKSRIMSCARNGYLTAGQLRYAGVIAAGYTTNPVVRADFIDPDYKKGIGLYWHVDRVIAHLDHVEAQKQQTEAKARDSRDLFAEAA